MLGVQLLRGVRRQPLSLEPDNTGGRKLLSMISRHVFSKGGFFMSFFVRLQEDGSFLPTTAGYTVIVLLMVGLMILGSVHFTKRKGIHPRQLAFSALSLSLAVVLSNIKFIRLPMGGTVTLFSMLFVVLIGYWFGLGAGLTSAITYGLLQIFIDPYLISFPQILVDYILAFGSLGLSGLFHGKKNGLIFGYLTCVCGRFFFSTLSGVIFFGTYAPEEFPSPFLYSAAYNGSYLGIEAAITVGILLIPQVRKAFRYVGRLASREAAPESSLT